LESKGEESRARAASREGAATAPSNNGFVAIEFGDASAVAGVAFSSLAAAAAAATEDLDRTTLSLPGRGLNLAGMDSHVLRPMMVALTTAEAGSVSEGEEEELEEEVTTFLARASTAAAFDSKSAAAAAALLVLLVLLVSSLK
jgi:hypothetical protein